jgi:hypothetical protein
MNQENLAGVAFPIRPDGWLIFALGKGSVPTLCSRSYTERVAGEHGFHLANTPADGNKGEWA